MNDHPGIENLPLEFDGIQVRETVREIFRNSDNGTPDNISKAGCLALALKSDELGRAIGEGKTHVLWNAWRGKFPTIVDGLNWKNTVNFSEMDFREKPNSYISFAAMRFGDRANFYKAKFSDWGNFTATQFGDMANFSDAIFGNCISSKGSAFRIRTFFQAAQFAGRIDFRFAQFGGTVDFSGAQLGNLADFRGAQFFGPANFGAQTWEQISFIYSNHFQTAKAWADARGLSPEIIEKIIFSGAIFKNQLDFSGRRFISTTDFSCWKESFITLHEFGLNEQRYPILTNQSTLKVDSRQVKQYHSSFGQAPIFHGCELHQDTSFEGAEFPDPIGHEESIRAYRTLKLGFSKQQAIREEQLFFRLEMREETVSYRLKAWQALKDVKPLIALRVIGIWLLYKLYALFSDYGFSIIRPFVLLTLLWLVFAQVYGGYTGLEVCWLNCGGCTMQSDWLAYSAQQALPLLGFENLADTGPIKSVSIGYLASHRIFSLTALFLLGLALRNLFKLK